jgi:hypothetical protein
MQKMAIILLLVWETVFLHAQENCPNSVVLPLIVQQVLNSNIVQEALYKDAGRNMYPMYIIYPRQLSTKKFAMNGFEADSVKSNISESRSVLKVTKFKFDEHLNKYKVKLLYNKNVTISVDVSINKDCTGANISRFLVYSKDIIKKSFMPFRKL